MIPFHNEEDSATQILGECCDALDTLVGNRSEIVAIDDGSLDGTAKVLAKAAKEDGRIRILTFDRNRGQVPALYYGLTKAAGRILVTIDGDGQNNPEDIPALLKFLQNSGADLVSGVRTSRKDSVLLRTMSKLANWIRRRILDDGVTDSGCALKAFHHSVVASLLPIQTLYSFIPALAKAAGKTVVECPVDHRPRVGGRTHYGLSAFLWRPALDLLGVWWFSRRRFAEARLIEGDETDLQQG